MSCVLKAGERPLRQRGGTVQAKRRACTKAWLSGQTWLWGGAQRPVQVGRPGCGVECKGLAEWADLAVGRCAKAWLNKLTCCGRVDSRTAEVM